MRPPKITTSRWFIYVSSGLLVFLCLAILLAGLILIRRSLQPRVGLVVGSSMEPSLRGPRVALLCDTCGFRNQFTADSWNENRPVECLQCGKPLEPNEPPEIVDGEHIEYMLLGKTDGWPTFRKRSGPVLQRWDQVVIRKGPDRPSEIKRIVGLPGETVSIQDGHIWINGQSSHRSPQEFFRQAILVAHWNYADSSTELNPWLQSIPSPLDNTLIINAHDSHVIVPATDVGVALRIRDASPNWSLRVDLKTQSQSRALRIDVNSTENVCTLPGTDFHQSSSDPGWHSPWIIVSTLDDKLHACDDRSTRFTFPAPSVDIATNKQLAAPESPGPVSVEVIEGAVTFDRCLIFRGIVYRGYGDMPTQSFPDGEGYVVLGDNVSISEDSRGAGDASIRVAREDIRGVILPDDIDLADLLRQSESLPAGTTK